MAEGPPDTLVSRNYPIPNLSCGIICVILRLVVFTQYRRVTDTHAQTDRRMDRYTTTACIALRGKNPP